MIAYAPPPPDYTDFRNRTSLQARVGQYGSWSSSGQPTQPPIVIHYQSGEKIFQERQVEQLRQALTKLTGIIGSAQQDNVLLSLHTLLTSFDLLSKFHTEVSPLAPHSPHITWSADAEVVLEWRQGEKRLLLYIKDNKTEYLKSWGNDIYSEMEDGEVLSMPEVTQLWGWLKI